MARHEVKTYFKELLYPLTPGRKLRCSGKERLVISGSRLKAKLVHSFHVTKGIYQECALVCDDCRGSTLLDDVALRQKGSTVLLDHPAFFSWSPLRWHFCCFNIMSSFKLIKGLRIFTLYCRLSDRAFTVVAPQHWKYLTEKPNQCLICNWTFFKCYFIALELYIYIIYCIVLFVLKFVVCTPCVSVFTNCLLSFILSFSWLPLVKHFGTTEKCYINKICLHKLD